MSDGDNITVGNLENARNIAIGRGAQVILPPEPLPRSSFHQLRPPPPHFTGRDQELKTLRAQAQQGIAISGLRGLGGVGKTALALVLAHELKAAYPDAQFFLDLRGPSANPATPAEALAHVIRAYHPLARLPDSEDELRAL